METPGGGVRNEIGGGRFDGPVIMFGRAENVNVASGPARIVPRQLRRRRGDFVNRVSDLELISSAVDSGAIVGLSGPGGVGKTALALQWLHAEQERFQDGQLCLDLGTTTDPMQPAAALGGLLSSLGVDPVAMPASYEDRYGLFLSLTAGRSLALFLENATTAAQVRQLLPASGVAVLVTSRARLTGLLRDGFVDLRVAPLRTEAAVVLLRHVAGRDTGSIPGTERLALLCGGYPLALAIVGTLLAARPFITEERLAEELSDGRNRLAKLAIPGDVSLPATFDVTYESLPAPVARIYRVLGLHPTPEFDVEVAAAALETDVGQAEAGLVALVEHRVLEQLTERRFRFHDLLWSHAGERAAAEDPAAERVRIVRRILGWYLERAAAADVAIQPQRWREGEVFQRVAAHPPVFTGQAPAREWLDLEQANVTAAVLFAELPAAAGDQVWIDEVACQLCIAGWPLYFGRKRYEDWVRTHTVGIAAARRLGDELATSKVLSQRGFAYLGTGRTAEAAEDFRAALRAAEACGNAQARSTAIESLGLAALAGRRYPEALARFDQALAEAITADPALSPRALALLRHHRGRALSGCGRHVEALAELGDTRAAMREIGDPYNEGRVLTSLGAAYRAAGLSGPAIDSLTAALTIMRSESVFETAEVAVALADLVEAGGDLTLARTLLAEALTAYAKLVAPQAKAVAERLAALPPAEPSS